MESSGGRPHLAMRFWQRVFARRADGRRERAPGHLVDERACPPVAEPSTDDPRSPRLRRQSPR